MNIQMLKQAIGTLFVLALLIPGAHAAETAGTVLYTTGKVTAIAADGSRRDLQRRSLVYVGDRLLTAAGARAQVRFTDGGIVALKPGSDLRLDDYVDADAANSTNVMSLIKGGFRTMTGAIGQRNKAAYKVNTPVATIGVRGTFYEASYAEGSGLSLGVWDGGITACNDGGCIDLGMNADHRFGFVPVSGAPQGAREKPEGLGDDDAGGDEMGDAGEDTAGLDSLGSGDVAASDLQNASLFGPVVEVSREVYKQIGYAFIPGAGVIAANYSRVDIYTDPLSPTVQTVTDWSLIDDSSGIELSAAPAEIVCRGECWLDNSYSASVNTSTPEPVSWGDWYRVDVGLSAGDTDPALSQADGSFVMAGYISPAEVSQFMATYVTGTMVLSGSFVDGRFQDANGYLLDGGFAGGGFDVNSSGVVSGSMWVDDNVGGTWNIIFDGTVNAGVLDIGLNSQSNYVSGGSTAVTGSIEASFFGSGSGTGNASVDGIIGGLDVATVSPNLVTGQVDTLDGIFQMNASVINP